MKLYNEIKKYFINVGESEEDINNILFINENNNLELYIYNYYYIIKKINKKYILISKNLKNNKIIKVRDIKYIIKLLKNNNL